MWGNIKWNKSRISVNVLQILHYLRASKIQKELFSSTYWTVTWAHFVRISIRIHICIGTYMYVNTSEYTYIILHVWYDNNLRILSFGRMLTYIHSKHYQHPNKDINNWLLNGTSFWGMILGLNCLRAWSVYYIFSTKKF